MSWAQDCACNKHRDSPSHLPLGHGEKNRVCDNDGNMEECLDPQYRGASLEPELPGKRRSRRLLSKCRATPVACWEGTVSLWECHPMRTGFDKSEASSSCWGGA
uniref:Uncharacterized protein n=1 Tax=Columba livia TaxID=8932 RepID=R7VSS5_COLLI